MPTLRSPLLAVVPLVAASLHLPACLWHACTEDERPSVLVSVAYADGTIVPNPKVTFSIGGRTPREAPCGEMNVEEDGEHCMNWAAGVEETGEFLVEAQSADGAQRAVAAVVVDRNE